VDRFARPQEFYSNVEHNEIAVFANYLANIINLLQTRNIEHLVQREKELQEELYNKHQEINQYKESIRSFLRNSRQGDTGIIFYKNRRFTYGNQIAKELLDLNLNQQEGHPVTQKLKNLARKVQEYKTPQSCFTKDKNGQRLVLSAVPHLEQNNVIIVMYYPEISDLVKKQIESLRDPSKWDYLLYLETTASGKMINQLIPSTGEHMLNFKISLLQAALSKKATLLEMPKEDLLPTVRLLHHISLRETLHTIKLTQPCTNNDIATKLFGINPIFGIQSEAPLLEKLDKNGTIFIQNIHYLDPESQEYLAEYLTYGAFRMFKSEQKMASNVRIICSTNTKLSLLVQEGTFSQRLFSQLNKHTLIMPSLLSVPDEEIYELAEGYTEQALKADDFKNLLELTDKEKTKISGARPISLQEFKSKIQQMIQNKSKKNDIYSETQFDPAFEVTDPELIEVARLGKNALRDETAMRLLWRKFKSQSKIASFLSVNRSSVNRRCKQYNLE
jgi:transcriptional regulator with PAS, ATPase and Fis domain